MNCRTYCLGESHFLKHSRWTLPQIKLGPNPGSLRAGDLSEGNLGGSEGIRRFSAKLRPAGTAQDPQLSTAHLKYPRRGDKYKDNERHIERIKLGGPPNEFLTPIKQGLRPLGSPSILSLAGPPSNTSDKNKANAKRQRAPPPHQGVYPDKN